MRRMNQTIILIKEIIKAFAATTSIVTVFGNKRIAVGEFTQASGDTGGAISSGFSSISYFQASSSIEESESSGTITIITADPGAGGQTGWWMAIGE